MKRFGFTMIELVFVIVVLGILAAIAVPKFAATRDDAQIAKGRSDVAAIRAAIVSERQSRLLTGQVDYIPSLGSSFEGDGARTLMMYPPSTGSEDGQWSGDGTTFNYSVQGTATTFTYNPANGTFNCTAGSGKCDLLTK